MKRGDNWCSYKYHDKLLLCNVYGSLCKGLGWFAMEFTVVFRLVEMTHLVDGFKIVCLIV